MKLEITLKTTKKILIFCKTNCAHFWMVKYLHQDFRITNQDKCISVILFLHKKLRACTNEV